MGYARISLKGKRLTSSLIKEQLDQLPASPGVYLMMAPIQTENPGESALSGNGDDNAV